MKEFKFSVEWLQDRFYDISGGINDFLDTKKKDDMLNWCLMTDKELKSNKQNSFFHDLLKLFWDSHKSSFESYEDLRLAYKEKAGLVKYEKLPMCNMLRKTLGALWLCLSSPEKEELKRLIEITTSKNVKILLTLILQFSETNLATKLEHLINNGKVKELSWAHVKKDNAIIAIKLLIQDMNKATVNGKKFDDIMKRQKDIW